MIGNFEWYNLGTSEKVHSAYTATANTLVDLGEYRIGEKDWLIMAVLAIGGSPHDDAVFIPDDWNLLNDTGTNFRRHESLRLVVCYQLANRRKKVDFSPVLSMARVWGGAMFSFKQKN